MYPGTVTARYSVIVTEGGLRKNFRGEDWFC